MHIFKRKRKPSTLTLPIDVFNFRAGDTVEVGQFFAVLDKDLDRNEAEKDDLRYENEQLKKEIDELQSDIQNFYKPRSPYEVNGVNPRDFFEM